MTARGTVAYFSMEIALQAGMPTYSGGLGVLAGDTLRSAADLGLPMLSVSLAHLKGYFRQELDPTGQQRERDDSWCPEDRLVRLDPQVRLDLEGRSVEISAWRYDIRGARGHVVPVFLLDTSSGRNAPEDRELTDYLYGGDERMRLRQEAVLGLGGVLVLRALGYHDIATYHLNEGHAALATLALLEEALHAGSARSVEQAVRRVRSRCVFTTHTPVPAGHDRFPVDLATAVLGPERMKSLEAFGVGEELHLTELALSASRFVNGVAMRHAEVSRRMFPAHRIQAVTNGIHPGTWASPPFQRLFDEHIPQWRVDPFNLRQAVGMALEKIDRAHAESKRALVDAVRAEAKVDLDPDAFTLGFARRATGYKRADLLFYDLDRLLAIAEQHGPIQVVLAGKAHPNDSDGKYIIRTLFRAARALEGEGRVTVAYLPNYDMRLGALLCAGADVWLNTPIPPLEASGTSGMKAALNGVPSLSILDGWWLEGCVEGVTGWAIGSDGDAASLEAERRDALHADALYAKLETAVLPRFHADPQGFLAVRRNAIALNGAHFHTHRMVLEYRHEAYEARGRGAA